MATETASAVFETPSAAFRFERERAPGTPWELGDILLITRIDDQGRENRLRFICTAEHDGRIVEATSEEAPSIRLLFDAVSVDA